MVDPGLPHWRLLLERLHATYRAPSFEEAAAFVHRLAGTAGGGVDVDLRGPGTVHLTVPAADVPAAEAVAALAAEAGLEPAPLAAAVAAGGTLVTDRFARSFWVLADAEGDEACACTWQDRG